MLFPRIEKACPICHGDLVFAGSAQHPDRRFYDVHTYKCETCGPMIQLTLLSDQFFAAKYPMGEKAC